MSKEEIPTGEELTDSNDEYLVNEDLSLDQEKLASAHKRSERLLDILSLGINGFVAVILILLIVVTLVIGVHYLTPECWHWLSDDQLTALKTFVFSGAIIGNVVLYLQRHTFPS